MEMTPPTTARLILSLPVVASMVSICASPVRRRARGEVDPHLCDVGAAQIVDDDPVEAAQRLELDGLGIVEIHPDAGHVAEEDHPPAIGEDLDVLGDAGAVEIERVGPVLALDDVVVVAGIPEELVVAVAEEGGVVAVAADHAVVAVAGDEMSSRRSRRSGSGS